MYAVDWLIHSLTQAPIVEHIRANLSTCPTIVLDQCSLLAGYRCSLVVIKPARQRRRTFSRRDNSLSWIKTLTQNGHVGSPSSRPARHSHVKTPHGSSGCSQPLAFSSRVSACRFHWRHVASQMLDTNRPRYLCVWMLE